MKFWLFIIVFAGSFFGANAQRLKSFDVEFTDNGKTISKAEYYYLAGDTLCKLTFANDKLDIDSAILNKQKIRLVAVFKRKAINFLIETDSFYFLKIGDYKEGFKNYYTVYHGSEYEEIVKSKLAKDIFRNKVVK